MEKTNNIREKSGFALIEIIVAVMIIGIMFGLGYGALKYVQRARITKTQAKLQEIQTDIRSYEANTNEYPSKIEDLTARPANLKGWQGPYADAEELKDAWGNEIQYQRNSKGAKPPYQLYSYGPKGPDATESDYIQAEI
jgi:general secretion pathway protein G